VPISNLLVAGYGRPSPAKLVVRTPAKAARKAIGEVEHRRDLGDVHDLLVNPTGLAQGLHVLVGAPVRLLGQLDREVEHRALLRLHPRVPVVRP
jgi:hypothetical protein